MISLRCGILINSYIYKMEKDLKTEETNLWLPEGRLEQGGIN